jgi:hypothetical protein
MGLRSLLCASGFANDLQAAKTLVWIKDTDVGFQQCQALSAHRSVEGVK